MAKVWSWCSGRVMVKFVPSVEETWGSSRDDKVTVKWRLRHRIQYQLRTSEKMLKLIYCISIPIEIKRKTKALDTARLPAACTDNICWGVDDVLPIPLAATSHHVSSALRKLCDHFLARLRYRWYLINTDNRIMILYY
jgi:hypothetical protein